MSLLKQRSIQVGQALHGYDRGHSLLASSESLPHLSESHLFVMSDLSGDQVLPGFNEYLTGYPLQEISSYAFAKTWYAPEMERPGCVWTHTLIIRGADLALVNDCSTLTRYFRRPTKNAAGWAAYEKKVNIELEETDDGSEAHSVYSSGLDIEILSALYGEPETPVFIPAESPQVFEKIILLLWSQQWPRLRRVFRFSTGSLESRSLEGRPFDIQVIPFKSRAAVQRELPNAALLDNTPESEFRNKINNLWLRRAQEDLWKPDPILREFLRDYGADVAPKRASFSRLLSAFDSIRRYRSAGTEFRPFVEELLDIFPSSSEAAKLKLAVLRPFPSETKGLQIPATNHQRFVELATLANDSALPHRIPDADEWAKSMIRENLGETLTFVRSVVDSAHINSVGQQLLDSIATNINADQLRSPASSPAVLLFLGIRNPALATEKTMWGLLASRSHEFLDLLANSNLNQEEWNGVLKAAVEARVPNVASAFVRVVGSSALRSALELAAESDSTSILDTDWHQEFSNQSAVVAGWLKQRTAPSANILKELSADLNPTDPAIRSLGADIWLPVADCSANLGVRSNVFLFVLGCQNPAGNPYELVVRTFEKIHRAAGFEVLGYESWALLRDVLPVLGSSKDWDVCERLRRLLVARFQTLGWPTKAFFQALENPGTLDRTLQFVTSQRELRPFARQIVADLEAGRAVLTADQSTVFGYFRKKLNRS